VEQTLYKDVSELKEWRGRAEEQHRSMERRIGNTEKIVEGLRTIAEAVNTTGSRVDMMGERVDKIATDVEEIKNRPAKRWEDILQKILLTAAGIVVGWLLKKLGIF
jgi:hypothetical protein